jgi:hypothetical protein
MALTSVNAASSLEAKLASLEAELAAVKADLKKQSKKINEVKAHDANDNIKWGADVRTSIDNINYDMADGTSRGKEDLMATRLWLNMAYAPDANNIFKGQLSYNKAFGADLGQPSSSWALNQFGGMRGFGYDTFNWFGNESLTNDNLKVRQAYWLYMGDSFLGATDIPWTFSVGRRPSTNGFLANLRDDDTAQSPLGHIINVEFDGLSSKLDLSKVTNIPGMSVKLCMGQGATNAIPMLGRTDGTQYSNDSEGMQDIKLGGFIVEPYNDGQVVTKATWFRAYDLPGFDSEQFMVAFADDSLAAPAYMTQQGDMEGGAFSMLIDGLTEDGYLSGVKLFGSVAYSKTRPYSDGQMLGVTMPTASGAYGFDLSDATADFTHMGADMGESKTGTSYWFGAQLPVTENGKLGLEYNHGSEYWRPFDYGEDTMIGSKLAARGDAMEAYFTWNFSEALSAQLRYTKIDYDYAGSNGFFAAGGTPIAIDDVKAGAAGFDSMAEDAGILPTDDQNTMVYKLATYMVGGNPANITATAADQAQGMVMMKGFSGSIVEAAQDLRFYIRYRF